LFNVLDSFLLFTPWSALACLVIQFVGVVYSAVNHHLSFVVGSSNFQNLGVHFI